MKEPHLLCSTMQDQTVVPPYVATTLVPAPLVHPHSESPAYAPIQIQHNQLWSVNQSSATNTAGLFSTINQTDLPLVCNQAIQPLGNTLGMFPLPSTTCTSSLSAFQNPTLQPNKVTPIATPQIYHDDDTPLQDETLDSFLNIDTNDPLMLEGMKANFDEAEPPLKKVAL